MSLTAAQAIALLTSNPGSYSTKESLLTLIGQLSVYAPGSTTLLFSNDLGYNNFDNIIDNLDGDFRLIGNTQAAEFLDLNTNTALKNKLIQIFGSDPTVKGTTANTFLYAADASDGAWATVSKNFAMSATGEVRTILPFADKDRVFGKTELKTLLFDNPNVTKIDGIHISVLRSIYTATEQLNGSTAALEAVFDTVKAASIVGLDDIHFGSGGPSLLQILKEDASLTRKLGEAMKFGSSAVKIVAGVYGKVTDLIQMYGALWETGEQIGQGDYVAASQTMGGWGAKFLGAAAGAEAASAATAASLSWLAFGGPVGVGILAVATVAAGIYGGVVGAEAANDLFRDSLNPNGAPSWDKERGIDLAMRDNDLGKSYRWALQMLNPFALMGPVPDVGDALDLYDPETGTGQITEEWIKARSELMAAYLQYQQRNDDDGVLGWFGAIPFMNRLGDTIIGDTHLPGGQLVIDGPDFWEVQPRYIRFGDENSNSLHGGPKEDMLFGAGGSDNLWGADEDDHLEGGDGADQLYGEAGNDKLIGGTGNDRLEGGAGQDTLDGGTGSDDYWISKNETSAVIRDADGVGKIVIEKADSSYYILGSEIHEIEGSPGNHEDDEGNRYRIVGNDLIIQIAEGGRVVTVESFATMAGSRLGIALQPAEPETPPPAPDTTNIIDRFDPNNVQGHRLYWPADIYGTAANDLVYTRSYIGGGGAMVVTDEYGGDDIVNGDAGADQVFGGSGNDWIFGAGYIDFLYGDLYWDDTVFGDDILVGGVGSDIMDGGGGNDQLWATDLGDINTIVATADVEEGLDQRGDVLFGNAGDDLLRGSAGWDVIDGGDGEDTLIGGGGNDFLLGDRHYDLQYQIPFPIVDVGDFEWGWSIVRTVNTLPNGTTTYNISIADSSGYTDFIPLAAGTTTEDGADHIYGGLGNDWLLAGGGNDFADGGDGDDLLFGEIGNDLLLGGAGADMLDGGDADDEDGADFLDGGEGDDLLRAGSGNDTLYGGEGADLLHADDGNEADGEDYLNGEEGDDILAGGGRADILIGGLGNDSLYGDYSNNPPALHGDDYLDGGAGNDLLIGEGGADTLIGGEGDDALYGESSSTPSAASGNDSLDGGAGNDLLFGFGGSDMLFGGDGEDQLVGDDASLPVGDHGHDYLDGGAGNDVLFGQGGDDVLLGGSGNDYLDGGTGNDTLIGGFGTDSLRGGAGNDTYVFEGGEFAVVGTTVDSINDTEGSNRVEFRSGLSSTEVTVSSGGGGAMELSRVERDVGLIVVGGFSGSVASITFSDGVTLTVSQLIGSRYQNQANQTSTDDGAQLYGGMADDTLIALGNNAVLSGGQGDDILIGGVGSTTYAFELGDGVDAIGDQSTDISSGGENKNTLQLGAGILESDVTLSFDAGTGLFTLQIGQGDGVTLSHFDATDVLNGSRTIDEVRFADGTVKTWAQLVAARTITVVNESGAATFAGTNVGDTIVGSDVGETIDAREGNDTLSGGGGNDVLNGGAGSDTYLFGRGSGSDTINNTDTAAGKVDRLQIAADVASSQLEFFKVANNLLVRIAGTADQVLVNNYFTTAGLDEVRLGDGTVYTAANIPWQNPPGNWFTVNRGSGYREITVNDPTDSIIDGVRFGSSVAPTDVVLSSNYNGDLVIRFRDANGTIGYADQIRILGGVTNPAAVLNLMVFDADPSVTWDTTEQHTRARIATDGGDYLYGLPGDDVLSGGGGSDYLYGMNGNDVLSGGADYDYLYGGNGNDTLSSGEHMEGGNGDDLLVISSRSAFVDGGSGSDTYLVERSTGSIWIESVDNDSTTTDVLKFGAGISPENVRFSRYSNYLHIRVIDPTLPLPYQRALDMTISFYFAAGGSDDVFDEIRFTDSPEVVWRYDDIFPRTLIGENIDESIAAYATNDVLRGNGGNDTLYGFGGDDDLDGGTGWDQLYGGDGNDTYRFDRTNEYDEIYDTSGSDQIAFASDILPGDVTLSRVSTRGQGTAPAVLADSLLLRINNTRNYLLVESFFAAGDSQRIESIRFGNGVTWDLATILANTVDQSGTAGALTGTSGNDTFDVDHPNDTVAEAANGGTDTIRSSVSYMLPNEVENLTLTGQFHLSGYGNSLNNVITGNAGDNQLGGGAGVDTLIGGAGDDTYYVDIPFLQTWDYHFLNFEDIVVEDADGGTDTLLAYIYSATLPANVERFILTPTQPGPSFWPYDADLTRRIIGNDLDNYIDASTARTFYGTTVYIDGGAGADIMIGNYEPNIYVVDNPNDVIFEPNSGGNDGVESYIDYNLGNNIRSLTLVGNLGISGTGNSFNNVMIGNTASNTLSGLAGNDTLEGSGGNDTLIGAEGNDSLDGGDGGDVMIGGSGNDVYYVDSAGDVVTEIAGEGVDEVVISSGPARTYSLTEFANVENLSLADYAGASSLIGDSGNNALDGNSSSNVLSGGAGNDVLIDSDSQYNYGYDFLYGEDGDDLLYSYGGYDTLDGGAGDDTMAIQGSGSRTIRFARNSGNDLLSNYSSQYSGTYIDLQDVTSSQVTLTRDLADLVLRINGDTGSLRVAYFFANESSYALGGGVAIQFSDGSYWAADQVADRVRALAGEAPSVNDDVLGGTLGGDVIDALAGNDRLFGFDGDDHLFGSEGNDELWGDGGGDQLDGGIDDDTLHGGDGNDTLSGGVGADYLFGDAGDDILDGGVDDDYLNDGFGNNTFIGGEGEDTFIGGSGNDVFIGGAGLDNMNGSNGSDTYRFAIGDGEDYISEWEGSLADIDTLELGAGITTANVIVTRDYDTVVLTVNGGADRIHLNNFFQSGNEIEFIRFADGTIWDAATVKNMASVITGTEGVDTLNGTESDDRIFGLGGNDTLNGNGGNDLLDGGAGNDTMKGNAGDDTYIVDSISDVVTETSGNGADTVQSSITWILGTSVENLVLTGTANINGTGNSSANIITGNIGNNAISGGSGADTMTGGAGNDTYTVDNAGDIVTELIGEGTDLVQSSVTYILGENVENLTLTGTSVINGTGNALDNAITGNSVNNTLAGGDGNDTLNGGSGSDAMSGGLGNDTFIVDNAGDTVSENASEGTDLVQSSVTFALGTHVENLTLTGTSAINGTGNALANVLTGNSGANVLDGGSGADALIGGAGNDTYVIDNAGDTVTENASEGTDLVQSSITYALGSNIENLTLTGSSAINATGNSLNNTLTGNSGANTLDGGTGNDTMIGGAGNDTYVVDSTGDIVTEAASGGTDLVQSSVTYTLGSEVENLTLMGTGVINGTGNTLANVLTGNGMNNSLDGGTGADTLIGGLGNDTYTVDNVGDVVTENLNEGTDLVQSSITYLLGNNVENLTLTLTGAINGTGNALVNTITGNSGANVLDGGAGADTLIGGAGNDTYVVDNTGDVVTEASSAGTDLVQSSVTYTLATNVENITLTGTANINATGNTLVNVLTGNSGNNTLDGGTGADQMSGGAGDDLYMVDNTSDVVTESAGAGIDTISSTVTITTLAANVENVTLTGSTTGVNATGNALDNILNGSTNSAANTLSGGTGNDTYIVGANDIVTEAASAGIDRINTAVQLSGSLAANVEMLFLTGSTAINGTGNTLANLLRGNDVNNTLTGGGGNDILEGGLGNDTVSNTAGNNLFNGGSGTDTLTGNSGNELFIGGTGNDAITTGTGADIIAFNKGDGQDTVAVSTTKDNTVSIGGGALYADLLFQKIGNDLLLKMGASDQITFTGYYTSASNRSVNTLQMIIEGTSDYVPGGGNVTKDNKVERFNFDGLVTAFDAARTANPSLTTWALTNALAAQYVAGSDTAALGGDLSYRYGRVGNLSDISFTPAGSILSNASFGTGTQALQTLTSLQDTSPRLS